MKEYRNKIIKKTIDHKQVTLYKSSTEHAPVVYVNMYMESGTAVLEMCEMLGCSPFHLVTISNLRWEEELSPWEHSPVVSDSDNFTGQAGEYLRCMTEEIIPFIREHIPDATRRIIAGYSMGGLFALYVPFLTDIFSGAVSASGSAWYPGFTDYTERHSFLQNPEAIYLSLGDAESRSKNSYLRQTEVCTKKLYELYQKKGIPSFFELNPGNHFKDAPLRLAKGITWILHHTL